MERLFGQSQKMLEIISIIHQGIFQMNIHERIYTYSMNMLDIVELEQGSFLYKSLHNMKRFCLIKN